MKPAKGDLCDEDRAEIESFLDAIWMERGLSSNTLSAYRHDLEGLARWLRANRGCSLLAAEREALLAYLAARMNDGAKPRSSSRLLSCIHGFYRHLVLSGRLQSDPSARIDSPRIGQQVPKSLSEQEVERLLMAPDVGTPLGLRDRSMLELMYACGLRVSELVQLQLGQVNLRQGVVRIAGKGGKERLIPLGEEAMSWLERYLGKGRAHGALPPYTAPRLCHPLAEPRCRFAGGADAAGPQRSFNHPDIHSRGTRPLAGVACASPSPGMNF